MLKELKDFGIEKNYFNIKRIGDFSGAREEGYSYINFHAIDFDETKKIICEKTKMRQEYKSCDALDIIVNKDKINFIEFKQIINYDDLVKFKDDSEKKDLIKKIKDSIKIISIIIGDDEFKYKEKIDCYKKNIIFSFSFPKNQIYLFQATLFHKIIVEGVSKLFYSEYNEEPIFIEMKNFN